MGEPFQFSYQAARDSFLGRVPPSNVTSYHHPLPGPDGLTALDTAWWENGDTDRVLVISSGTHGIEGYCGSFVQCALLDEGLVSNALPQTSVLLIHGVNPHGFAWQRRVNEDNIDLNRNFLDHNDPYPVNEGYREIASVLEPAEWGPGTDTTINASLKAAALRHPENPRWLQAAMSGGQYEFPKGQFYGGSAPSWSYNTIMQVARTCLPGKDVTWIDVHTALGDYATAQCIVNLPPGSRELARAQAIWGERVGNIAAASSVATDVSGTLVQGVERELDQSILWTGLEYGTVSAREVSLALVQDQWLHTYEDADSDMARAVKRRMMAAFYPDDSEWRDAVLDIARDVVTATIMS